MFCLVYINIYTFSDLKQAENGVFEYQLADEDAAAATAAEIPFAVDAYSGALTVTHPHLMDRETSQGFNITVRLTIIEIVYILPKILFSLLACRGCVEPMECIAPYETSLLLLLFVTVSICQCLRWMAVMTDQCNHQSSELFCIQDYKQLIIIIVTGTHYLCQA